jgi:hypothetical protein
VFQAIACQTSFYLKITLGHGSNTHGIETKFDQTSSRFGIDFEGFTSIGHVNHPFVITFNRGSKLPLVHCCQIVSGRYQFDSNGQAAICSPY